MPKLGEIRYLQSIGPDGAEHAFNKPFSDSCCGRYLADLGSVMTLLPPPPARVLDLGVGTGWTTAFLSRRGYDVLGRDICPDMIDLAEQNRERYDASATFEVGDYESMPFRAEFDAALFFDSLHHAEDELSALAATYAALKPGGVCVTVEPGVGHSAASAEIAATLGVTERDMPPRHIIAVGRSVGFRHFRVFSRTVEPTLLVSAGPDGAIGSTTRPARMRTAFAFARKTLRSLLLGAREGDGEFLFHLPPKLCAGNIVWMQK